MNKGLLIVISGPSGAGKGTICKALLEKHPEIKLSVSCTTRSPRQNEVEGINYYFITKEKFKEMIENDEFLEYAEVYDNYYGTPKANVERILNEGNDIILEIDIQGALKVKEKYPEGVFVFIMPPSMEELKNRIKKRGSETEESLIKRFKAAFQEINYVANYNYVIVNDVVEEAVKRLEAIIVAEKCRVDRLKGNYIFLQEGFLND
ncbi:guanylate kinase [Thermobrachium celere]|uniref:Guanylate kinase n=1 Tax=Thermobrachium celere DSM 8682 TaxID=941824 RepID=R7RNV6_9CLOT|nr:guanylate kinase [Thermobrachium celere]GFR35057.1 guanylate kinase [Thermobrachium celere]CDF57882.1 Guanylate kinase [Thermobrachium celere DSM 8682]